MPSKAIILREGPSRLLWKRTARGWELERLWPSPQEREKIIERAVRGDTFYLRLEQNAEEPIVAFEEEVLHLPAGVRAFFAENGVLLLKFTLFDWLPEPARLEGHAFQKALSKPRQGLHPLLLPSRYLRGLVFLHAGSWLSDEHILKGLDLPAWNLA